MLKHWNISHGGLSSITNSIFYGLSNTTSSTLTVSGRPDLPSQAFTLFTTGSLQFPQQFIQTQSPNWLSSTKDPKAATAKAEIFPVIHKRPQKPRATAQADRNASRRHCHSQATAQASKAVT